MYELLLSVISLFASASGSAISELDDMEFCSRKPSILEYWKDQHNLKKVTKNSVPEALSTAPLVECVVTQALCPDKFKQPRWKVHANHVYTTPDQFPEADFIIMSPAKKFGGVVLKTGKTYLISPAAFPPFKRRTEWQYFAFKLRVLKLRRSSWTTP